MPKAKAWMERNVTCHLTCIAHPMAKIFPIKSLSIETQRQKGFIPNVYRFIITLMNKKHLQGRER